MAKEGGEAVVVVHRPPLERVVVALRALQSHTKKDLRSLLGNEVRLFGYQLEVGRRRSEGRAAAGQQFAHNLVEGSLRRKRVAQVAPEQRRSFGLHRLRIDLQHVGPHRCLRCSKLGTLEQLIDQQRALVFAGVIQERARRLGCRQHAR